MWKKIKPAIITFFIFYFVLQCGISKAENDTATSTNISSSKASFEGKVSHHSESNRSSDTSAKYSISVKGKQEKPEGLMKVLDMLNSSIGKEKGTPASGDSSGN